MDRNPIQLAEKHKQGSHSCHSFTAVAPNTISILEDAMQGELLKWEVQIINLLSTGYFLSPLLLSTLSWENMRYKLLGRLLVAARTFSKQNDDGFLCSILPLSIAVMAMEMTDFLLHKRLGPVLWYFWAQQQVVLVDFEYLNVPVFSLTIALALAAYGHCLCKQILVARCGFEATAHM